MSKVYERVKCVGMLTWSRNNFHKSIHKNGAVRGRDVRQNNICVEWLPPERNKLAKNHCFLGIIVLKGALPHLKMQTNAME